MADQNQTAAEEEEKWVRVSDLIRESGLSFEEVRAALEGLAECGEIEMRIVKNG